MRKSLLVAAFCLASPGLAHPFPGWDLPAGAKVYKDKRGTIAPGGKQIRVIFYYKEMTWAGVTILSPDGREIATATMELPHGLAEPSGLHRLKGDSSTQVVLFGRVGAKSAWARVYDLEGDRLHQIFDWSGWSFRVLELAGRAVIAAQPYQTGSLTDLYLWRDTRFEKANEMFPQFYASEIASQEKFIQVGMAPFASRFAQACRLVAQGLLYGRRYVEARRQCEQALVAIGSRCCSGASSAPTEVIREDKIRAEEQIRDTIKHIQAAEIRKSTSLSVGPATPKP